MTWPAISARPCLEVVQRRSGATRGEGDLRVGFERHPLPAGVAEIPIVVDARQRHRHLPAPPAAVVRRGVAFREQSFLLVCVAIVRLAEPHPIST